MGFRILADEHCERQMVERLAAKGHDVERVVDVPSLGPGSNDRRIASYARDDDRLVLTSDVDFLSEFDADDHAGVLFVPDDTLEAGRVVTIVSSIATYLEQDQITDVVYVTDSWA